MTITMLPRKAYCLRGHGTLARNTVDKPLHGVRIYCKTCANNCLGECNYTAWGETPEEAYEYARQQWLYDWALNLIPKSIALALFLIFCFTVVFYSILLIYDLMVK